MTTTLPDILAFPGYDVATPRPGGGWERLRGADWERLPVVDLDTIGPCGTNGYSDPTAYDREWCCTANVAPGWHVATVMGGHIVAVWPDPAVRDRVNANRADSGGAS